MVIYDNAGIIGKPDGFNYANTAVGDINESDNYVNPSGNYVGEANNRKPSLVRAMTAKEWMQLAANEKDPVNLYDTLWQEGEVCCLFADSNLGKSILAVQIANAISKSQKVVYFDFELTRKQFQLRYSDPQTGLFPFNENFIRGEISTETASEDFETDIMTAIEQVALENDAKVLIIDNLTWLCNSSETGDSAGILMQNLIALKKVYGWSILVIAHTPKRQPNSPITQNDLAGSKRLFNFFDSVFAIGQSAKDPALRYIKQLKVRSGEFKYDSDNVIEAEIVKEQGMTFFRKLGYATERSHLREPSDNDRLEKARQAQQLQQDGQSIRKIATEMRISTSSVQRLLRLPVE